MSSASNPITFFTDNDVDDAVGNFLMDSGHIVRRLRDEMLTDSADPVVAAFCRAEGLVLITHNVRHFKRISSKEQARTGAPDSLNRIEMDHHQVKSVSRIETALSIIEFVWEETFRDAAGMRIVVGKRVVSVER